MWSCKKPLAGKRDGAFLGQVVEVNNCLRRSFWRADRSAPPQVLTFWGESITFMPTLLLKMARRTRLEEMLQFMLTDPSPKTKSSPANWLELYWLILGMCKFPSL